MTSFTGTTRWCDWSGSWHSGVPDDWSLCSKFQSCDASGSWSDCARPDGYVEGTAGADLIDSAYTGDPEGDRIDNGDAVLPGEAPDDDIVLAGAGDDTIRSGAGNDEVYAGSGDDVVDSGAGDDFVEGNAGDDCIVGGNGNDTLYGDEASSAGGDRFPTWKQDISNVVFYFDTDGDGEIDYSVKVDGFPDSGSGTFISNDLDVYYAQLRDYVVRTDPVLGEDAVVVGVSIKGGLQPTQYFAVDGDANGSDPDAGPTQNTGPDNDATYAYTAFHGTYDPDTGVPGDDKISGGDGLDLIYGGGGDDTADGGTGNDTIYGGTGRDHVSGGDGDDVIDAGVVDTAHRPDRGYPGLFPADANPYDDRDTVYGGSGNDSISTGDDNDVIDAGTGNDTVNAGFDDDCVYGGDGNDSIVGGEGSDLLKGGAGNDTIWGGLGATLDELNIPDATDLRPDNGRDLIYAGDGDDVVMGQDDDDTLYGGSGNDSLDGNIDEDVLHGDAGDDTLLGGDGDDTAFGGTGGDRFFGGAGKDSLSGGDDRDIFISGNAGDFVDGNEGGDDYDTLDLTGAGPLRVVYDPSNSENGTVTFLDDNGNVEGTLEFRNIENVIPCFTPGTLIATPRGERPVEDLKAGDRVITRDNGIQEIRWIGQKALNWRTLGTQPHLRPVLVRKGALGHGLPERDMMVSPNHRVLVANDQTQLYFEEREVLVAAKHLVNNAGIVSAESLGVTYIHFMFDHHEVVLSDGCWTESFQPGDFTLKGIGNSQRAEILELFPELKEQAGLQGYGAARRTLKKHEAQMLFK
jgi:Ca2+-binding RTX toxin-like protein